MAERDGKYYRAYLEHYSISRRGLFRGLFSGANKAAKLSQPAMIIRDVARPPGAVEEGVFRQRCQSCSACEAACPEQLIEMVDGYPQLNLDFNYCTHCEACADSCKTGAISYVITKRGDTAPVKVARADIGLRPVFSSGCNHRLSGSCTACVDACPERAIQLVAHQLPTLNDEACIGCGQCRSACFLGAIQLSFKMV